MADYYYSLTATTKEAVNEAEGCLVLNNAEEKSSASYVTITINRKSDDYIWQICLVYNPYGLEPNVSFYGRKCLIGINQHVYILDLQKKELAEKIDAETDIFFDYIFHKQLIILIFETRIILLNSEFHIIHRDELSDIITGFKMKDDILYIEFMDSHGVEVEFEGFY